MAKKKTSKYDEIEELDRVYNSLTGPAKKKSKTSLVSVLTVLLGVTWVMLQAMVNHS